MAGVSIVSLLFSVRLIAPWSLLLHETLEKAMLPGLASLVQVNDHNPAPVIPERPEYPGVWGGDTFVKSVEGDVVCRLLVEINIQDGDKTV